MSNAQAIQRLLDEAEIRRVLALLCHRIDEYDIDAAVGLFTEDCRLVRDQGSSAALRSHAEGRAAVAALMKHNQARHAQTLHQIGNVVIDLDGDVADCVSNAVCWHREQDGGVVLVLLRYVDRLARVGDTWRIATRRLVAQGVEGAGGLAESDWAWLARRQPPAAEGTS